MLPSGLTRASRVATERLRVRLRHRRGRQSRWSERRHPVSNPGVQRGRWSSSGHVVGASTHSHPARAIAAARPLTRCGTTARSGVNVRAGGLKKDGPAGHGANGTGRFCA